MQSFVATTLGSQLEIKAGETKSVDFTVSNTSGEAVRGRVRIIPEAEMPANWIKLAAGQEAERDFAPDHTESFTFDITIPQNADAGTFHLALRVVNTELDKIEVDFHDSQDVAVVVEPTEPPKRIKWWMIVIVVVVLLLVVGGIVAYFLSRDPELAITVDGPGGAVIAGSSMSYEIAVSNSGSAAAADVVVLDTLPDQVAFVTADQNCEIDSDAENVLHCEIEGEIGAGEEATITLQVDVAGSARGQITNRVSTADERGEAVTDTTVTQIDPLVNLSFVAGGPEVIVSDEMLRYDVQLTNEGPSTATGLILTYGKPLEIFEIAANTQNAECTDSGEFIHCAINNLDASEMVTMTVSILPGPGAADPLTSVFRAVSDELEDPLFSESLVTNVTPATGLSIAFDASSGWAVEDREFNYSLLVRNNNPNRQATDVEVRNELPEGMLYVSSNPPCASLPQGARVTLICELGDLDSEMASSVDVKVTPTIGGTFDNIARITSTSSWFQEEVVSNSTFVERSFANSGVNLDGKEDWVRLQDFNLPESFTIEMWVNPRSTDDKQSFIGKHTSGGDNIFLFGYWSGGVHVNIRDQQETGGAKETGLQHLAVVVERASPTSSQVTVYRNGNLLWANTINAILTNNISGKKWVLGQDWDNNTPTDFLNANMTEVRIWDHARSQDDIQSLMFRHLDGNEDGLVGYWPLDERSGTVVRDASGSGLNGELQGTPCWVSGRMICNIDILDQVFELDTFEHFEFELAPQP